MKNFVFIPTCTANKHWRFYSLKPTVTRELGFYGLFRQTNVIHTWCQPFGNSKTTTWFNDIGLSPLLFSVPNDIRHFHILKFTWKESHRKTTSTRNYFFHFFRYRYYDCDLLFWSRIYRVSHNLPPLLHDISITINVYQIGYRVWNSRLLCIWKDNDQKPSDRFFSINFVKSVHTRDLFLSYSSMGIWVKFMSRSRHGSFKKNPYYMVMPYHKNPYSRGYKI